jgi:hypothetical protein
MRKPLYPATPTEIAIDVILAIMALFVAIGIKVALSPLFPLQIFFLVWLHNRAMLNFFIRSVAWITPGSYFVVWFSQLEPLDQWKGR